MTEKEFQKLIKEALKFYDPKKPEIPERVLNFDGDRMSNIYINAYKQILALLLNQLSINGDLTNINNMTLLSIMSQVDKILYGADLEMTEMVTKELEKEYVNGQLNHYIATEQNFSALDIAKNFPLSQIPKHKVNQLVGDTMEDLLFATGNTRKSIKKLVQSTVAKHIQLGAIQGENYDEIKKQITKELTKSGLSKTIKEEGFVGIIDKRGRKWNVNTYSDMVVQTKMHQAYTEGLKDRALETGKDLAKIPHKGAKDPCKNFEGMIISLTGSTKEFPSYDQLKSTGLIFHPKCRHSPVPIGRIEILPDEDLAEHFKRMEELQELNGKKPKKKSKEDQDKKIQDLKQRLKNKYDGIDMSKPKDQGEEKIIDPEQDLKPKKLRLEDPKYIERKYGIPITFDDEGDAQDLFKKLPKEYHQAINKYTDDLFTKYPKLLELGKLNGIMYHDHENWKENGAYNLIGNDLKMNLGKLRYAFDPEAELSKEEREHDISDFIHTYIHELGHYVDLMVGRASLKKPDFRRSSDGDFLIGDDKYLYSSKHLSKLMKEKGWAFTKHERFIELGAYADTHINETMAEGWGYILTHKYHPETLSMSYKGEKYGSSKLGEDIVELYENLLEKYFK